jgi:hypothetical protein
VIGTWPLCRDHRFGRFFSNACSVSTKTWPRMARLSGSTFFKLSCDACLSVLNLEIDDIARSAARYKVDMPKATAAVREELSSKATSHRSEAIMNKTSPNASGQRREVRIQKREKKALQKHMGGCA